MILSLRGWAAYLLIPMDDTQKNHLKAYGIAYWVLTYDVEIYWLLNYRGGSFLVPGDYDFSTKSGQRTLESGDEVRIAYVRSRIKAEPRLTRVVGEVEAER